MNNFDLIKQAVNLLQQGKLVAIPTETVYGLAGDAKNVSAIKAIYQAKGRPDTNPLIVHISNIEQINDWAIHIPDKAFQLAEKFWPGPLTLILQKHPDVPYCVTGNQDTVGIRIPNHPLTLELLKAFGGGLAAPSANRYGRISPTTATAVKEELNESVDLILDGGPCQVGIESTIISLIDDSPIILRQGAILASEIETLLNQKMNIHQRIKEKIIVPGMHDVHYAPEKPLYLIDKLQILDFLTKERSLKKQTAILSFSEKPALFNESHGVWLQADPDPHIYATHLYSNLRQLDHSATKTILVEAPPYKEEWLAILDRLQRAAHRS